MRRPGLRPIRLGALIIVLAPLLVLLGGAANADEPEARWVDDTTYLGNDGRYRTLVRPEFRSAPAIKADLDALTLAGLEVELVAPYVAQPPPAEGQPALPPEAGRLMLLGTPEVVRDALRHVGALDVPPRMVEISMLISEVTCVADTSEGARWNVAPGSLSDPDGSVFRGFDSRFDPEAWLDTELTGSRPFEGTTLAFADSDTLGLAWAATFRMLMKRGYAELFNWPTLMCSEEQPAILEALETVWFPEPQTPAPAQSTRLQSQEVGLKLIVRPFRVGTDTAIVDLDLWLMVPEAMERSDTRTGSVGFRERRVTTRVTLRDREPLLLGGLFLRRIATLKKGIPVVERVLLLDALTGSHDKQVVDTELVFLVQGQIRALMQPARDIAETPFPDPLRDPVMSIPNQAPISAWSPSAPAEPEAPGAESSADLGEAPAGR